MPISLRIIHLFESHRDLGIITRKTYDEDALGVLEQTQDNCFISSQCNSFIDMAIFNDWAKETFVPELIDRRRKWSDDGPAFLILDNCSAIPGTISPGYASKTELSRFFSPHTRQTNSSHLISAFLE
jgi:hypothetical protein